MANIAAIQGAELVAFLNDSTEGQTKSVIIEAKRPLVRAPARLGQHAIASSRRMLPPPAKVLENRSSKEVVGTTPVAMENVAKALKRLGLDGLARRNDLSGSFVVEATAEQIQELASAPGVQVIRPNRRHRNIVA
jgi:hypothetical protein